MKDKHTEQKAPFFSIIVPAYNIEGYLAECLDSVAAQDFADCEVIIVDDGSNDRSGEIGDAYAAGNEHIRVIHQTNAGVSAARNTGMAVASGMYVIFLDGDDRLVDGYLKKAYDTIQKTPNLSVYTAGYYIFSDSGERIEAVPVANPERKCRGAGTESSYADWRYIKELFSKNGRRIIMLTRSVFDLRAIKRAGIEFDASLKYGEDFDFFMACITSFYGDTIPAFSYYYRKARDGQATATGSQRGIIDSLKSYAKWYNAVRGCNDEKSVGDRNWIASDIADKYIFQTIQSGRLKGADRKECLALAQTYGEMLKDGNHPFAKAASRLCRIIGWDMGSVLLSRVFSLYRKTLNKR
jgi:glycosyltransferase involved in cell wall biosynthesis